MSVRVDMGYSSKCIDKIDSCFKLRVLLPNQDTDGLHVSNYLISQW